LSSALFVFILCICSANLLAAESESSRLESENLPRYKFEVGQELIYELTADEDLLPQSGDDENEKDGTARRRTRKCTVWVVRKNDDDSWRLLVRSQIKNEDIPPQGDPKVTFENDFLSFFDLYSDGSYKTNPSMGAHFFFKLYPEFFVVRFPATAKSLKSGWDYVSPVDSAKFSFHEVGRDNEVLHLDGSVVRPRDVNHESQFAYHIDFEIRRGLVTRIIRESKADWTLNPWHTRSTISLTSVTNREPKWIVEFALDVEPYFAAKELWWKLTSATGRTRAKSACQDILDEMRQALVDGQQRAKLDETREPYASALALHDREAKWALDKAGNREDLYSKPPVDWETTDYNDLPHRLVDYRGKVVVMDFWYRGCGHCIECLPKIKRLASFYSDKDVAVIGMCNDKKDEDARYVIENFDLSYPNLRSQEIAKQYKVNSWPTVIVLDQTGRIAANTSGNSEDLHKYVEEVVVDLLENPPSTTP
jgi:thiol-disulfide isomerase/thioredoxin